MSHLIFPAQRLRDEVAMNRIYLSLSVGKWTSCMWHYQKRPLPIIALQSYEIVSYHLHFQIPTFLLGSFGHIGCHGHVCAARRAEERPIHPFGPGAGELSVEKQLPKRFSLKAFKPSPRQNKPPLLNFQRWFSVREMG